MANQTVPTFAPSVSVGPATPVVEMAQSEPQAAWAPSAIWSAVNSLTTPSLAISSSSTPASEAFNSRA